MVQSMMKGLIDVEEKITGEPAVGRAAIISFGFVFIHPFEDGNGRIHRFLIHDMLTRDGLAEQGLIIPVSAHMVNNMKDYDAALESYSKPLMQRIKFQQDEKGELTISNPQEVTVYFRYPDLTAQSAYLAKTIQATIQQVYREGNEKRDHKAKCLESAHNIVVASLCFQCNRVRSPYSILG